MFWPSPCAWLLVFLTVAIINVIVGLIVDYYDSTQSIYWHVLSPFLMAAVLLIMLVSVIYEFYTFRLGGYSLAKAIRCASFKFN